MRRWRETYSKMWLLGGLVILQRTMPSLVEEARRGAIGVAGKGDRPALRKCAGGSGRECAVFAPLFTFKRGQALTTSLA
jgi:hypothetical protein